MSPSKMGKPKKSMPTHEAPRDAATAALAPPIYPATVYACRSPQEAADLLAGETEGFIYSRDGHPNSDMLAKECKACHAAEEAAITGSGMAALALALISQLKQGDHVVVSHQLYGRTLGLFTTEAARCGIDSTVVDTCDLASVERVIHDKTRLVITETIANPMLQVADIGGLAEIAHACHAQLLIDNTFASPVVCRPLELGADLVVESMTKIMNGHSDVILGCLCGNTASWDRVPLAASTWGLFASPHSCWLSLRGMATMGLRVGQATRTAREIAERLHGHPALSELHYPGLPDNPHRGLAQQQFSKVSGDDCYGNMITFRLAGNVEVVDKFIYTLSPEIPFCPSLGDLKTTISHPESTSHRELSSSRRQELGIHPGTIRLSIGIESVDVIFAQLQKGLTAIASSP